MARVAGLAVVFIDRWLSEFELGLMDDDEAFLDIIDFGCTQTQPKSPIGEQPTPSTQHRSAITEKGKSHKGKNWSSDEDKTRELETSVKKQKKTIDASPGTATNDPADASSVRTDATSIRTDALEHETRPDGVKKDKRGKADDIACKFSLETVWAAKQEKDEIKEAARNARYAQQLELRKEEIALKKKEDARNEREDARRQFELDERVMLMDTSGMTDAQKQFYQAKQKEILARGLE
ncbi:hypothetical protein D1007_43235 [Hordeum vulgare]|nr:hypothetical protein D1007_43235 [Hordeum vulgare]